MNKYSDYQKKLRNKRLLKIQCIVVAVIIAFTLGTGTLFAYLMFDNSTRFSNMIYDKIESNVTAEEETEDGEENEENEKSGGYVLRCRCGKSYRYDYCPENTAGYYCTKCGDSLENASFEDMTEAA